MLRLQSLHAAECLELGRVFFEKIDESLKHLQRFRPEMMFDPLHLVLDGFFVQSQ